MTEFDRVEWSCGQEALEALDDRWDALAGRHPTPFALTEWLEPWWRSFGQGRQPALCRAWRDDELVGGLAMASTRGRLVGMANIDTPMIPVLHADAAALHALARSVASSSAGVVSLGRLPLNGRETEALCEAARASGGATRAAPASVAPVVETTGDFEAYLASRGDGWKRFEQRRRRAAREHVLDVVVVARPRGGVAFLEEGLAVEASGWKGREGTAIVSRSDTAAFYREMASRFAEREELALSGLWLDGHLVAFDLALLYGNRYWALKTGYLESFDHLAPGLILRRAVIERCFELNLKSHEFLGSDLPWKRMFATSYRPHCTWTRYRYRPRPLTELVWHGARPLAKRVYRAFRPR